MIPLELHPDRLFPAEPSVRALARSLYQAVRDLPIVSPHGHTDPRWYADNERFPDPAALFIVPDHYVFRMLYSQGISLESLGVPFRQSSSADTRNPRIDSMDRTPRRDDLRQQRPLCDRAAMGDYHRVRSE